MSKKIIKVSSTFPWIVYEEGGVVLGYAYATRYRERAAYRWSLEDSVYLRQDVTGRGLGMLLLETLIELLRELGYMKVYGVITPPNPASVGLHKKLGFTPLCRFADTAYKLGSWQAIDWMELSLRDPASLPPGPPPEPIPFPDFARDSARRLEEILG